MEGISSLPDEIIADILLFFDVKFRLRCSLVCKRWNRILAEASMLNDVMLRIEWRNFQQIVPTINFMKRSYPNISVRFSEFPNFDEKFTYDPNFEGWQELSFNVKELNLKVHELEFDELIPLLVPCVHLRTLNIVLHPLHPSEQLHEVMSHSTKTSKKNSSNTRDEFLQKDGVIPKLSSIRIEVNDRIRFRLRDDGSWRVPPEAKFLERILECSEHGLTSLDLAYYGHVVDGEIFSLIAELKKLKFLALSCNRFESAALKTLVDNLPELGKLEIRTEVLSGDDLERIQEAENFTHLVIRIDSLCTKDFFSLFCKFDNLQYLDFDVFGAYGDFSSLKSLKNLRHLLLPVIYPFAYYDFEIPQEILSKLHTLRVGSKFLQTTKTFECPELHELQLLLDEEQPTRFFVPQLRILRVQLLGTWSVKRFLTMMMKEINCDHKLVKQQAVDFSGNRLRRTFFHKFYKR